MRDVATDGCVHLLYNSSWKVHQLAAGQLMSWQPVRYGKGRWYGPSITYKITPAGSHSSSLPGGPPVLDQPSSLRPHCSYMQNFVHSVQLNLHVTYSTLALIVQDTLLYCKINYMVNPIVSIKWFWRGHCKKYSNIYADFSFHSNMNNMYCTLAQYCC